MGADTCMPEKMSCPSVGRKTSWLQTSRAAGWMQSGWQGICCAGHCDVIPARLGPCPMERNCPLALAEKCACAKRAWSVLYRTAMITLAVAVQHTCSSMGACGQPATAKARPCSTTLGTSSCCCWRRTGLSCCCKAYYCVCRDGGDRGHNGRIKGRLGLKNARGQS